MCEVIRCNGLMNGVSEFCYWWARGGGSERRRKVGVNLCEGEFRGLVMVPQMWDGLRNKLVLRSDGLISTGVSLNTSR
jgi:hypothetical protein